MKFQILFESMEKGLLFLLHRPISISKILHKKEKSKHVESEKCSICKISQFYWVLIEFRNPKNF